MAGLAFLSPLFLLGALAVAVPVVLHLLRRRTDPVQPFSAVKLLREVPVERTRRRRLRDLLLFALRVAALLLLALSFARPYRARAGGAEPPVTVVLVDVSASLGDPGRAARLQELARRAVNLAPGGDQVALVTFSARSNVIVAPVADRGAVKAAIGRLGPGSGPTSYTSGLARAAEVIGKRGGRVVVVTDLQAGGWTGGPAGTLPSDVDVAVEDVGPPPSDLGVVALTRTGDGVSARLRNTGPARQATVTIEVNGAERATRTTGIGAGQTAEVGANLRLTDGDAVRARVADPGGLPGDDERWLVVETHPPPRVDVVVSPGASQQDGLYARRALEALDGARAVDVHVRTADRVQAEGVPSAVAAVVLIGTAGLDRRGAEAIAGYVRAGGGLLLAVGPGINPEILQAGFGDGLPRLRVRPPGLAGRTLALAETRHPVLGAFAGHPGAFTDVRFTRTAAVLGTDASDVLARFDTGEPALVATPLGKGRVLVFASDLANRWNDLALQPAFVPLLGEAVHWLADVQSVPGELVAEATLLPGADRPGVAEWPARGEGPRPRVAVNAEPREFDPARQTAAQFLSQVPRGRPAGGVPGEAEARRDEAAQGLWRYGLGLMLVSLVVESLVGRRV
jgi:Aerotolerance regulator N-terminal/von Willebrand factor type A domain